MRGPPARHPDESREQLPAPEGFIAEAAELSPGVRVVYPNQGVCAVIGVEEKDIAGQKLQLIRLRREEDGAAVMVPRNKVPSIGLRRVATGEQIEGVFHYLAAVFDDPELDWKIRHRDNADRLIAGGVLGVAEVVKGLHALSRLRPLPAKEREQYDNARHLLVHEVAVALQVPAGVAEDFIDFALMPPAGVEFDLKPPPAPVLLPSRPRRKKPAAEGDDLGDLGLGDLGLDLDLDGALREVPGAEAEGEGAAASGEEGEGEGAAASGEEAESAGDDDGGAPDAAAPGDREDEAAPRHAKAGKRPAAKKPAEKAKAPRKAAARPAAKKPAPAEKAAAHKDRPAAKPVKKAAAKPAKKPAARKK